jgi:hypothetical protein
MARQISDRKRSLTNPEFSLWRKRLELWEKAIEAKHDKLIIGVRRNPHAAVKMVGIL